VTSPHSIFATHTTTKLLDALNRLTVSSEPAWQHIDARYRPVIRGLARRLGLGDSDCEEVAQQTLSEFVRVYREGRYDRSKGRLSSWLLSIAHHTALKAFRSRGKDSSGGGSSVLPEVTDEPTLRSIWDDERDREVLARAMSILRDESALDDRTLQAFELVALRGVPAPEAAAQCSMTVEQVYVAKSRVTGKLRKLVEELTAAFEEDA
jgi:RNA polymerase sigma factor (sigma-70 family)